MEGLHKHADDFSLNYYMGLLYKIKCEYKLSEYYYKKGLDKAKNDNEIGRIYKDLQYLYYDYATYLEKKALKVMQLYTMDYRADMLKIRI